MRLSGLKVIFFVLLVENYFGKALELLCMFAVDKLRHERRSRLGPTSGVFGWVSVVVTQPLALPQTHTHTRKLSGRKLIFQFHAAPPNYSFSKHQRRSL